MGIMDGAGDDPAGFPTERHFASSAPHLVAAANLEDALAARRTGLRVFLEEGGGFHIVLVTNVILFFDLAALAADVCFAHLAFPSCRQETFAVGDGARLGEFGSNILLFSVMNVVLVLPDLLI